jgi:hypothetical protein
MIKGTSLGESVATGIDISEFIVASPDKYLSKINYTYLTPSCLLPLAFCLSLLGN